MALSQQARLRIVRPLTAWRVRILEGTLRRTLDCLEGRVRLGSIGSIEPPPFPCRQMMARRVGRKQDQGPTQVLRVYFNGRASASHTAAQASAERNRMDPWSSDRRNQAARSSKSNQLNPLGFSSRLSFGPTLGWRILRTLASGRTERSPLRASERLIRWPSVRIQHGPLSKEKPATTPGWRRRIPEQ